MPAVHFIASGKVQGVFFRQSAKAEAERLGITGWIRNNPDSTVEGVAVGTELQIRNFVSWCRHGPSQAIVDALHISGVTEEIFSGFEVR